MLAFILRSKRNPGAALYPIAGRPLLERQLEWLYDSGVDMVYLELGREDIDAEIEQWLSSSPLGLRVRVLKASGRGNRLPDLAKVVSHPENSPVVSLMSDQMVRMDLTAYFGESVKGGVRLMLTAAGLGLAPAEVWIAKLGERPTRNLEACGWGAHLESVDEAIKLSSALLTCGGKVGDFEIPIPGTEISPGVWVARGVRVSDGASLRAPVYIGAGSWIQTAALVGPNCHLGEYTVVAGGAELSNTVVPDNALVDLTGIQVGETTAVGGLVLQSMALLLASPFLATAEVARRCKEALWG